MSLAIALLLAAAQSPNLYQRVEESLAARPEVAAGLGHPAPQMREVAWLVGTWDIVATVEGRETPVERGTSVVTPIFGGAWLEIRDTYPAGNQDIAYLGYSLAEGSWLNVSLDSLVNGHRSTALAWQNGRIVFEGDFVILGVRARLRQSVQREGEDAYTVTNEEWLDRGWHRLDSYRYTRRR